MKGEERRKKNRNEFREINGKAPESTECFINYRMRKKEVLIF